MHFLGLPFDILSLISNSISQRDALQLAQTNHRAYDIAMPWVLASVVIGENRPLGLRFGPTLRPQMRGAQQLSMLTSFLLSDAERWATCIRTLTLHPNAFGCPPQPGRLFSQRDYSGGPLLAEALGNAHNLRNVDIGDVEVLLQQCPSFGDVLCGFAQLDRVKFSGLGSLSAAMLKHLRSHPRIIELHGVGTQVQAILHSLRPHAATVEVLALEGCFSTPTNVDTPIFHRVHTLTLGGYAPPLATMAIAFPTVRTGCFHNFRQAGKTTQNVEWVKWPSLDTVELSALIPLSSPVRHTRLGSGLILNPHTPSETVSGLLSILHRTQPVVLSFMISGLPLGFFDGLTTNVRSLRYLEMTRINTLHDSVGLFLAEALNSISTLPLVAISMGRVRGIEPSVTEMDNEAAALIANMLPTVRFIGSFGSSDDPACLNRRWFTVPSESSAPRRRVQEVPQHEIGHITSFLESLDRKDK